MHEADERYGPIQELWRSQETAPVEAQTARIRAQAERLDTAVTARNRRENLVVFPLAGYFLLVAAVETARGNAVSMGGALLVSASMLWVRFAIRRWGRSGLAPEDLSRDGQSFIARYRRELVRQRRLVLHAWLWYVLPIGAGLSLVNLGSALRRGGSVEAWLGSSLFLGTALVALVVVLLNLVAARDLTRRIGELPPPEGAEAG